MFHFIPHISLTVFRKSLTDENSSSNKSQLRTISLHEENERVSSELHSMRSRAYQEVTQESLIREREIRDAQTELEWCRMERAGSGEGEIN
jgi:hypothetical protein